MDWTELLIPGLTAFAFMSVVWAFIEAGVSKARLSAEAGEAIAKAEHDAILEQVERERYLELRDMFAVNEPEWHILNEAAGEPDYFEQNKPLRRKMDDWPKCQPEGEVEVIYAETIDGKRQAFYKSASTLQTHRWTPPDWLKSTDVYREDWGSSSSQAN